MKITINHIKMSLDNNKFYKVFYNDPKLRYTYLYEYDTEEKYNNDDPDRVLIYKDGELTKIDNKEESDHE